MMLIYPGMDNIAHSRTVGATRVQVAYFGKAAHAAARPELGINALDAMLLAFNGISALRQQLPSEVRVHSHHHQGRNACRRSCPITPPAVLTVRANDPATLERVIPRIDACLTGAALMTGARLERTWREQPGPRAAEQRRHRQKLRAQSEGSRPPDPAARRAVGRMVGRYRQRELVRADDPAADGHDRPRRAAP